MPRVFGEALVAYARAHGIVKRPGERDEAFRARLSRAIEMKNTGSFVAIEYAVDEVIEDARPVMVSREVVRRLLAVRWLRAERPSGLWARLCWVWRLVREVWR